MPICKQCNTSFSTTIIIENKPHHSTHRTRCFRCSPFKSHNIRQETIDTKEHRKQACIRCGKSSFRGKHCSACCVTLWRNRTKQKAVDYLGGECQICGYNKSIYSLDFHHRDPNQKDFGIGTGHTRAWNKVKAELDKCILVCRNCHGEIHAGITEIPTVNMDEINKLAEEVLEKSARTFMHREHGMLDGLTPFQATQNGRQSDVERILHSIEHGLPV